MGLIDTLTSGFRLAQHRLWLILLPALLDIWLWLGSHLSIKPLVDGLLVFWSPANMPPDLAQTVEPYRQILADAGASFNLWWLLDNGITWLRTLTPGLAEPARFGPAAAVIEVPTLALALWAPLLLVIGVGLGSILLTAVTSQLPAIAESKPAAAGASGSETARAADDEPERRPLSFWMRRALRTWALVTIFGLALLVVLVALMGVLSIALTPILVFAPQVAAGLSTLLALLAAWALLWVYFMLYFVVAALVTDGATLSQALWRSVNVVARNFWPTLGLVVLTTIILGGFGLIWQRLATLSPWGMLVGIAGNSFLLIGLIAGLDAPSSGSVAIDGVDITRLDEDALARLRGEKIGFVFQAFNLLRRTSAIDNVEQPLIYAGMSPRERRQRAEAALEAVGLGNRLHHHPSELSGGQQQRVAIARALAMDPVAMLFDEPTSALDPEMISEVLEVMTELAREGMTMVVVTHEMGFARRVAHRIAFMDGGRIVEVAPTETFFAEAQAARARDFLSKILSH